MVKDAVKAAAFVESQIYSTWHAVSCQDGIYVIKTNIRKRLTKRGWLRTV